MNWGQQLIGLVAGLGLVVACRGPERLATQSVGEDDSLASSPERADSEPVDTTDAADTAIGSLGYGCTLVRSVEFHSPHARMVDLHVSLAPDGVFLGHAGPTQSSMLSHGGWDGSEVSLRSESSDVYSGALPIISPSGAQLAVETYRGDGETGYDFHMLLRAVPLAGGDASPVDVGVVAWDPRLTVTAAATARDYGHGVFAHASVSSGRWLYLLRTDESGAVAGFWSRNYGEGVSRPLLEVLPSSEGGLVSALYGEAGANPVEWRLTDVPPDGQALSEYVYELDLPDVNLTTPQKTVAVVAVADGFGLVWRDEAGQVGLVRADREGNLDRVGFELTLPTTSNLAAAAVRRAIAIVACDSEGCTLDLIDEAGHLLGEPVAFAGSTPTIVAVDDARLVLSYLTTTSRVVSEWDCE